MCEQTSGDQTKRWCVFIVGRVNRRFLPNITTTQTPYSSHNDNSKLDTTQLDLLNQTYSPYFSFIIPPFLIYHHQLLRKSYHHLPPGQSPDYGYLDMQLRGISSALIGGAVLVTLTSTVDAFWRMECRARSGLGRIDPLMNPGEAASHAHAIHGSNGKHSCFSP